MRYLPALFAALAVAACDHNVVTAFPPGLEPLEAENLAPLPAPVAGDEYPETVEFAQGATADYSWAHARGYVHASVADTWTAMQDPDVVTDRRKVDSWTVTQGVEPYYVSFLVHNVVNSVITITFDITWRQDAVEGTRQAPQVVAGRWQKTNGSSYMDLLEGSVALTPVTDQVTEVAYIEHLKAMGQGAETIKSYLGDFHASLVAKVHGQPLPSWK